MLLLIFFVSFITAAFAFAVVIFIAVRMGRVRLIDDIRKPVTFIDPLKASKTFSNSFTVPFTSEVVPQFDRSNTVTNGNTVYSNNIAELGNDGIFIQIDGRVQNQGLVNNFGYSKTRALVSMLTFVPPDSRLAA